MVILHEDKFETIKIERSRAVKNGGPSRADAIEYQRDSIILASADFPFDAEIERTLRTRLRQARLARLESDEEQPSIHSGSDSGLEREIKTMGENPPPPERLLGDYGGANAPTGRLTIVNQPVNVANFQLHPSTINQLERKHFTGKEEMEKAFLNEYFPASVFLRKRYEILNFKQKNGETLGGAYKRFKRVLVACPTHNMDPTKQMQMFVNGLKIKTKQFIHIAAGGSTNFSTSTSIKKIIEAIAANEHLELYGRCQSKPEWVIHLKLETNKIRIEDTIAAEIEKRLKAMNIGTQQVAQVLLVPTVCCEICNAPHQTVYCFATPQQVEVTKFFMQNNPYSNTYNPGWKNHPNFSWKDQKGNTPQHGQYQTQYQQQKQQQAPKKADWEISIERMQLASSSEAQGALPSTTVTNPGEHNNVSVVITRSGKSNEVVEEMDEEEDRLIKVDLEIKENGVVREELVAPKLVMREIVTEPKLVVKLPFPTRNKKKGQHEKKFEKFLELFKKLEINIPLLEALEQMHTYAKFMKGIVSKRRAIDTNPIILTETCSAILQGASVNLMLLSIYKNLGIGVV
ncbi:uncharacterized protein LOC127080953 [Lathyrus oleraceus]|uniref:uncharacterized protein LOC127080953 n=1 Tax=Pisum sativum TaxID=3888 RepID=UPI0021D3E84A|nr:uncharacterized protein LOC127080953 [Pisum sativum]